MNALIRYVLVAALVVTTPHVAANSLTPTVGAPSPAAGKIKTIVVAPAPHAKPKSPVSGEIVFGGGVDKIRMVVRELRGSQYAVLVDSTVELGQIGDKAPVQLLNATNFTAGCVKSGSKTKVVPGVVQSGVDLNVSRTGTGVAIYGEIRSQALIQKVPSNICTMETVSQEVKSVMTTMSSEQLRDPVMISSWVADGKSYQLLAHWIH